MITLVYGQPKTGKTTFAATVPGIKIIDLEGGTRAVKAETTQVDAWEDLAKEVQGIVAKPPRAVALDSITVAHELALNFVSGRKRVDLLTVAKPVSLPQYGQANELVKSLILTLRGLDIPVVLTGQAKVTYVDEADPEDADVAQTKEVTLALPGQARQFALMYADVIGYTESVKRDSNTGYRMWLKPTQGIVAGCRADIAARRPCLVSPNWERLERYLAHD